MPYLSCRVPAEQIQENFKAWWRSEEHGMMTQGTGPEMDGDSDADDEPVIQDGVAVETLDTFEEEAQEIDYEANDVAAMASQANLHLFTSAEDHAAMKAELAALQEKVDPTKYFTCSLSEICLLDPLETVLCQLRTASCSTAGAKLVLTFPEKFAELLETISDNPQQWLKATPTEESAVAGPSEVEASAKVWAPAMFSRSMAGSKNIEDFLQRLPAACKAAGFQILDGDGKIFVGTSLVRYDVITMRAAEFFDITFAAVSTKNFGKSVLADLAEVCPKDPTSAARLRKLRSRIDK
ncbi:unnamed protein product, partial [Symbiodinium necroappetens]